MSDADLQSLVRQVLWAGFAVGVAFGAIAQRTQFCTMGAVADVINIGDWTRVRMWAMAIGVAILGFNGMVAMGWFQASATAFGAPNWPWLSQLVGGLMFGFGMVLASGCGSKTLVRIGGGNLKSVAVFFVLGASAFATLKGITAVLRVGTLDVHSFALPGQDLPSLAAAAFGGSVQRHALWLGALAGLTLLAWAIRRPEGRSPDALLGGLGLGVLIAAGWWVSGRLGHLIEHPKTLEEVYLATNSQRMESLSFVAPYGYLLDYLLYFSDTSKSLTLGMVSLMGVVVGSGVTALASGTFRWEGFRGVEDTANHLIGAVLMGVGGVTAVGCTIGQGMSGLSTLSLGSLLAVAAIVVGAVLALRWQVWRLERSA